MKLEVGKKYLLVRGSFHRREPLKLRVLEESHTAYRFENDSGARFWRGKEELFVNWDVMEETNGSNKVG